MHKILQYAEKRIALYLMLRECSSSYCHWIFGSFHKQESIQIVSLFPDAACFTPVAAAPGRCLLLDILLQTLLNLIRPTWQALREDFSESIKLLCWLPGGFLTRSQSATDHMILKYLSIPETVSKNSWYLIRRTNPGEAAGEQTLSSLTTISLVQCLIPPLLKTWFSKVMNYCFPSNGFALEARTISQIAPSV